MHWSDKGMHVKLLYVKRNTQHTYVNVPLGKKENAETRVFCSRVPNEERKSGQMHVGARKKCSSPRRSLSWWWMHLGAWRRNGKSLACTRTPRPSGGGGRQCSSPMLVHRQRHQSCKRSILLQRRIRHANSLCSPGHAFWSLRPSVWPHCTIVPETPTSETLDGGEV